MGLAARAITRRGAWGLLASSALGASGARAEEAQDWQLGFQPAASVVRERIDFLHNVILLPIITVISLFVLGLLLWVMIRYNAKRNPVPSKISHNTTLEILWTLVPVLILLVIAIPSFKLLYFMDKAEHADMTLKVTGHQWYWNYEYPDQNGVSFDSNMIPEEDAAKLHKKRLLDVDFPLVLPVNTTIRVLVSGADVIHSWFVPSFGVQEYALAGRTNESWVKIDREGTFYGQCNQICGVNHPFMPIEVKAVSSDKFTTWSACAKAAADDKARAACYAPLETAHADETDKDAARVAANALAADAVK
ncbi:MAG TPA: cytochrome c oxidase subunit II [Stellaceae bacterium]|jgi:cytochrome c oxidase subunit 2|nr:cytochrome c oxidase subunit II [Stellaceae bacterium]